MTGLPMCRLDEKSLASELIDGVSDGEGDDALDEWVYELEGLIPVTL